MNFVKLFPHVTFPIAVWYVEGKGELALHYLNLACSFLACYQNTVHAPCKTDQLLTIIYKATFVVTCV